MYKNIGQKSGPCSRLKIKSLLSNNNNSHVRSTAFTLVEVLIVIAIIGIVAALSLPILFQNSQKKQTVTKLQKVYSTISNAYKLSQSEHGTEWGAQIFTTNEEQEAFLQEYMYKYLNIDHYCGNIESDKTCFVEKSYVLNTKDSSFGTYSATRFRFRLLDGVTIISWVGEDGDHIHFYVDINGFNKPNIIGRDIFVISVIFAVQGISPGVYLPAFSADGTFSSNFTREQLLNDSETFSCNKAKRGQNCGALIQKDGWEIKSDYPWQ